MKTLAIALAASTLFSFVMLTAPEAEARPYCTDLVHNCDDLVCFYTPKASGCIGNPCDPRWCDPMPFCPRCMIEPLLP